jgi:hypothetical protein
MTKRRMSHRRDMRRGVERLVSVLVGVSVSNIDARWCGLFCPYQVDTDKTTISCILEGTKTRLKWSKDDELMRSTFCRKHEREDRRPSAQMIKSFIQ